MADEENDSLRAKILHNILKYSPFVGNCMSIEIIYSSKLIMIMFIIK